MLHCVKTAQPKSEGGRGGSVEDTACCPTPLNAKSRAILQAAKRCFERHGFHAASMAAIASEAGISVGNVYRYFANKEAVIAAIVREDLDEIAQDIETLRGDGDEMAGAILAHFQRTRSRQHTVLRLEIMAEGARNPKVAQMILSMEQSLRARLHAVIASVCSNRNETSPLDDDDIEARMSLIGVLMDGLQLRTIQEGGDPPPRLLEHVHALLAQVLSPAPIGIDAPKPAMDVPA